MQSQLCCVYGKRENLYSKNFWYESSIQVETYGIEITSSGTSLVEFFETYEFSETNEKSDTNISEKFLNL